MPEPSVVRSSSWNELRHGDRGEGMKLRTQDALQQLVATTAKLSMQGRVSVEIVAE